MDFLTTVLYLPASLIGWGISIIMWYFIISFVFVKVKDWWEST